MAPPMEPPSSLGPSKQKRDSNAVSVGFPEADRKVNTETEIFRENRLKHSILNSNLPPDHPWRKFEAARRQPSVPLNPQNRINNACGAASPPRRSDAATDAAENQQHDAGGPAAKRQKLSFVDDPFDDGDHSWGALYNFDEDQALLETYGSPGQLAARADPTGGDARDESSNRLAAQPNEIPKDWMNRQDCGALQLPGMAIQPRMNLDATKLVGRHRKREKRAKKLRQEREEDVLDLVEQVSLLQRELSEARYFRETTNGLRAEVAALGARCGAAEARSDRLQARVEGLEGQVVYLKGEVRALRGDVEDLRN